MNRERLDALIGLRHSGNADEGVILDVGERGFLERGYARIVGKFHIERRAVARLDHVCRAVDLFDLSAETPLLLRVGGCRKKQSNGHRADCPARYIQFVHPNSSQFGTDLQPAPIRRITPSLSPLFRAGNAQFFLSKSASTMARNSGVTSGRTPNQR